MSVPANLPSVPMLNIQPKDLFQQSPCYIYTMSLTKLSIAPFGLLMCLFYLNNSKHQYTLFQTYFFYIYVLC